MPADPESPPPRRAGKTIVLVGCLAAAGGLLLTAALVTQGGKRASLIEPQPPIALPFAPLPSPIELQSEAPSSAPGVRSPARPSVPEREWSPVAGRRPSRSATPPPPMELSPGSRVGLELAGEPGRRVRHRGFVARVDPIGPGSDEGDRLDAEFAVRSGLAGQGCVSLESVNFPGRFLRHRDFVLRLDVRERTPLFAADATFCVVPRDGGASLSLRSVNYPDRFVSERDSALLLTPAAPAEATAFVVRRPL